VQAHGVGLELVRHRPDDALHPSIGVPAIGVPSIGIPSIG
jgi:hypothetical protein